MSTIKSRPHGATAHTLQMGLALAALTLPFAAAAAETAKQKSKLPEIQVKADTDNEFKASQASSGKYTQPLVDTPQTIVVIKRELFEQQSAQTLTDALRNTPGIGTFFLGENGNTTTGDAVMMRGFDASSDIFVDGVRDIGSISRDLFNIEQIDVLKGNAGTDTGRSSPTGSINMASKQPRLENASSASLTLGSASQKRVTADSNVILNETNGSAFRINALIMDSGVPGRDRVNNQRWAIAPSLAYGLGSDIRMMLNYLHVKQDNLPESFVPTVGLPGFTSPDQTRPFLGGAAKVDSSNFYGLDSDFDKVTADMLTAKIERDFSSNSRLTNISRYGKTSQNYLITSFMTTGANWVTPNPADPAGWTLARNIRMQKDQSNEILTNQTNWLYSTRLGSSEHDFLSGVEITSEKQNTWNYGGLGSTLPANLYHPNPADPVSGMQRFRNGVNTQGSTSTVSAYLFDTIKFNQQWQLNAGLRVDRYNTEYQASSLSTAASHPGLPVGTLVPTSLSSSDNLFNWKVGLLYKPASFNSIYASASSSKQPPGGSNFALSTAANSASNPRFGPLEIRNIEIGSKWDLLQEKLAFTAAIYRTDVTNGVELNPLDQNYYQIGEKRVEGLELGVNGAINRDWLVSAGYGWTDTSVEAGRIATATGENNLSYAPKKTLSVWSSYQLLPNWKVAGGARFVDAFNRNSSSSIGTPTGTESYWIFDLMSSYSINQHIDLQLNINNLTDKTYVAGINRSGYRYRPGAPRSFVATLNLKF